MFGERRKVWKFSWLDEWTCLQGKHEQDGFYITVSCIAERVCQSKILNPVFDMLSADDIGSSKVVVWIKT